MAGDINQLVVLQDQYIKMLENELSDIIMLAAIHGWKSSGYERGVEIRKAIAAARGAPAESIEET